MKFIIKGLHDKFDAEIPIRNEESINQFIEEIKNIATKTTMSIINAIVNEENICHVIKNNINKKEQKMGNYTTFHSDNHYIANFTKKISGDNILSTGAFLKKMREQGGLTIRYNEHYNKLKIKYSYSSDGGLIKSILSPNASHVL